LLPILNLSILASSLSHSSKEIEIKPKRSQTEKESGGEAVERMMGKLKVYADRMSQPSRAVLIFCR